MDARRCGEAGSGEHRIVNDVLRLAAMHVEGKAPATAPPAVVPLPAPAREATTFEVEVPTPSSGRKAMASVLLVPEGDPEYADWVDDPRAHRCWFGLAVFRTFEETAAIRPLPAPPAMWT